MFEKFKNNSLKVYGLCPSHYLSALGLSYDAMIKITKIKLEVVPDPDMYIFFEKGTRGQISYISNRYRKASNKYLKLYGPKKESKHTIYLLIIYVVMQCPNLCQQIDSNEYILKSLTWINIPAIVQKDVLLKLILNILKSYENYTMIIF